MSAGSVPVPAPLLVASRADGAVNTMPRTLRWWARAAGVFMLRLPGRALLGLLWVYQRFVSPLTPPSCKYYPSCSQYAVVAIRRHGAVRGTWLAARRLGRCHPWAAGGVDDVPPARENSAHDHGPRRARSSRR